MSRGQDYSRFNASVRSALKPDLGPVDDEPCAVGACDDDAVYRVPWPQVGGDVAYCPYHLARYREQHPDLWERVEEAVDDDLSAYPRYRESSRCPRVERRGSRRALRGWSRCRVSGLLPTPAVASGSRTSSTTSSSASTSSRLSQTRRPSWSSYSSVIMATFLFLRIPIPEVPPVKTVEIGSIWRCSQW